ncbi:MAG: helix-turn-helix domain-containing protein [Oscillospiraceae bacterium]|nr:helix-turn-helix domain-containing protein [Oscillospiraceae bacterium]
MADYQQRICKLQNLNPYEALGKTLFQQEGKGLTHVQYLYLAKNQLPENPIEALKSPAALREQGEITKSFHDRFGEYGLTERDFFAPDADIEVEQLLRYVEIPAHAHEFMECACVLRGTCIHRGEDTEHIQTEGSFLFVPAPERHQLIAVDDAVCITIKVRLAAFIKLSIPHLPSMTYPLRFQCDQDPAFESMLLFLLDQQSSKQPYRKELMQMAFTCLVTYILQNYSDTMQPLYNISIQDQQMLEMINYMYENYRTITLRGLAAHFHYNESYLSRFFREQAGRSFSATVKDFKLRKAAELLKTERWKLNQICEEIGYKDTRQFIRSFKELFGVTPERYRKLNQIESDAK